MLRRPLTALLIALAASGGLLACGGGDDVGDVVPNETPELLPPGEGTAELPESPDGETATTGTTTTDTTEDGTAAPAPSSPAPAPAPAPAPDPAPAPAPDAGGAPAAPDAGGAPAAPEAGGETGGFSDFCAQNPGACPE